MVTHRLTCGFAKLAVVASGVFRHPVDILVPGRPIRVLPRSHVTADVTALGASDEVVTGQGRPYDPRLGAPAGTYDLWHDGGGVGADLVVGCWSFCGPRTKDGTSPRRSRAARGGSHWMCQASYGAHDCSCPGAGAGASSTVRTCRCADVGELSLHVFPEGEGLKGIVAGRRAQACRTVLEQTSDRQPRVPA